MDKNEELLTVLYQLVKKYGFNEASSTVDTVLENACVNMDDVDAVQRWKLDTLLHEISHYVCARGTFLHENVETLHPDFWQFANDCQEVQAVALVHMIQNTLCQHNAWIGRTTSLDESILECGLNGPWKTSGRAHEMAQIMIQTQQMVEWANGVRAVIVAAVYERRRQLGTAM
jgi:hypothetical protein